MQLEHEGSSTSEKHVAVRALELVKQEFAKLFPNDCTSIEEDLNLLKTELPWRKYICVVHRLNMKEIVDDNVNRL